MGCIKWTMDYAACTPTMPYLIPLYLLCIIDVSDMGYGMFLPQKITHPLRVVRRESSFFPRLLLFLSSSLIIHSASRIHSHTPILSPSTADCQLRVM
jgi:hypothetical protein